MIELITTWYIAIQANPLVLTIFGSTIIGGILYICKDLPKMIFWFIMDCLTIKLIVFEDNNYEAYKCVEFELNKNKMFYLTGRFNLIYKWITKKLELSCGEKSLYLTNLGGVWALISKHTDTNVQLWHEFYYDIRFFTRNKEKIEEFFVTKYKEQYSLSEDDTIKIYQWIDNCWDCLVKKKVDIPLYLNNDKHSVCKKISTFLNNEELYIQRNIPYKEGFIFYGIPGCGKSYFIFQLASMFDLNIYYFNLNSFSNDNEFIKAVVKQNQPSIMLIEDIDCHDNTQDREINDNSKKNKSEEVKNIIEDKDKKDKKTGVSLSTILNVLDGMLSQEGQIIIITTNHMEKLDPALIRAGRFNFKLEFTYLTKDEICLYLNIYYQKTFSKDKIKNLKITAAELAGLCSNNETIEELLDNINQII